MYAQQYKLSKKDTSDVRFVNSRKFWIYKVEKGETLFSISQKFKIPQEEIHEFNKDLAEKGLSAKMKIWIPAYSWLNKNEVVEKLAEEPDDKNREQNRRLRILIITTFELQKLYIGNQKDDSMYIREALPANASENLEFVEGALISAKDISDADHKLDLIIKDSQGDSSQIINIFSKLDLNTLDLIITNENGSTLRAINKYSVKANIPLFSAGINTTDIIRNNTHAYALSPSSLLQCQLMGNSISTFFNNANCLLLKTGVNREDERVIAFKNGWMETVKAGKVKNVNFSSGYTKVVKDSMQKSKLNVLFVPSSNEDIISSLLSSLKPIIADYKIAVVGLPTWLYSQSIDPELFDTCNTYLFSAGYIDFQNHSVTEFRKKFRDHYHTEPMELAYLGYDVLQIALKKCAPDVGRKTKEKKNSSFKGIYSTYQFLETDDGTCKENHVIQLFKFEEGIPIHFKIEQIEE